MQNKCEVCGQTFGNVGALYSHTGSRRCDMAEQVLQTMREGLVPCGALWQRAKATGHATRRAHGISRGFKGKREHVIVGWVAPAGIMAAIKRGEL